METWKPIVGWEDIFEVSDQGRVRRLCGAHGTVAGRIRKTPLSSWGYPRVNLQQNGRMQGIQVHRAVAAAFLGPCPAGKEVNHIDGNPANAALTNLEYVTSSENRLHSYRVLGRQPCRGAAQGSAKLSEEQVLEIVKRHKGGEQQITLAAHFGVTPPTINAIVVGRKWSWLTGIYY
jgi:hypothetical protein